MLSASTLSCSASVSTGFGRQVSLSIAPMARPGTRFPSLAFLLVSKITVTFATEQRLASVVSWQITQLAPAGLSASQTVRPQNCPVAQALPHAPQLPLSTSKLLQRSEQQILSLRQPVLVPSSAAPHAAVHSPPLQIRPPAHSRSSTQRAQS